MQVGGSWIISCTGLCVCVRVCVRVRACVCCGVLLFNLYSPCHLPCLLVTPSSDPGEWEEGLVEM